MSVMYVLCRVLCLSFPVSTWDMWVDRHLDLNPEKGAKIGRDGCKGAWEENL